MKAGLFVATVVFCDCLSAQIVTTVAGSDWIFPQQPIPGVGAPLGALGCNPGLCGVNGVAVNSRGAVFLSSIDNNMVFSLSVDGMLSVFAGNGRRGLSGDGGPALEASLNQPTGLAFDGQDNLYISDTGNNRVRIVTADGNINTVAGNGEFNSAVIDGVPATSSQLAHPSGLWIDTAGNLLIADTAHGRIRKVTPGGIITTVAGTSNLVIPLGDGGPATKAFVFPYGVTADNNGNIYIADTGNHRVRIVSPDGIIRTFAGLYQNMNTGDGGPATSATLEYPTDVRLDAQGNVYIAAGSSVRRVTNGIIRTVAGSASSQSLGDGGPALDASLVAQAIALDSAGNLFIAERTNMLVRRVGRDGIINTVAGGGAYRFSGDGGPAQDAVFNLPFGITLDSQGSLYIADTANCRVRRVSADGTIATLAGNGTPGYSGDSGPATAASLMYPWDVKVDASGNVYIADEGNHVIRKVTPDGTITTFAGTGSIGSDGDDGPATQATFYSPVALAIDAQGNLYIADYGSNVVRKVGTNGMISTFAGVCCFPGYGGDGGPATSAGLNTPSGLAFDQAGNLYIVETDGAALRRVSLDGTMSTVAGNGVNEYLGDGGAATNAALAFPAGVAVDSNNNIYIADTGNNRVRRVNAAGIITTIAGNGLQGSSGDGGPATRAAFQGPYALAVDPQNNLYVSDAGNGRIRLIPAVPPTFSAASSALTFSATAGSGVVLPPQTLALSSSVNLAFSVTASTLQGGNWLNVNIQSGTFPAAIQVSADPTGLAAGAYTGVITIVARDASPQSQTIPVILTIQGTQPAGLSLDTSSLSLSAAAGGADQAATAKVISGSGTVSFTAAAATNDGAAWLSVTPANGTAASASPGSLAITVHPASLAAGSYQGTVSVTSSAGKATIAVALTVQAAAGTLLVSQPNLSFTAVASGGPPLPQSFGILFAGQGSMSWSTSVSFLSASAGWLQVSPSSGVVNRPYLDVSPVNLQVDPTGLQPGDYYARVQIAASASGSPAIVTVQLTVLPAGAIPPPDISPTSLIFTGPAGTNPSSQDVQINLHQPQSTSFLSGSSGSGFTYDPPGAVVQPGQPTTVRVFPDFTNLPAGQLARGTITLQFADHTLRTISVLSLAAPPPGQ
jgi:sugar lactone lactonase YvrE